METLRLVLAASVTMSAACTADMVEPEPFVPPRPPALVGDEQPACDIPPQHVLTHDDTAQCVGTPGEWTWSVYAIPIESGDCVWVKADNAGGDEDDAADLVALMYDGAGNFATTDDDADCTVHPEGGFGCPDAGAVFDAQQVYVAISQYPGICTVNVDDPMQIDIAVNGVDVDLSAVPYVGDYVWWPPL